MVSSLLCLAQLIAMLRLRTCHGSPVICFLVFVSLARWPGVSLAVPQATTAANSYAVTLDKSVPSSGDFDCGQTDSDGNSRSYCIVCSPAGGVRAVAAACDATPGCVAFDIQRRAGRCARLKSASGLMEGLISAPGYTHYCKMDGSGRCRTGHFAWIPSVSVPLRTGADLNCSGVLTPQPPPAAAAAVTPIPVSPLCSSCNRHSLVDSGGYCSVCGVDAMLLTCAASPDCAAVEYTQRDICGRVKVLAGPLLAVADRNVYVKLQRQRSLGNPIASNLTVATAGVTVGRPAELPGASASATAAVVGR